MSRELVIYVQVKNKDEKWEMLPLKAKDRYFDKDYKYAYIWYSGNEVYDFLQDEARPLNDDEVKYLNEAVNGKYDEDDIYTNWFKMSFTKLRLLPYITKTEPKDEEDVWYEDPEVINIVKNIYDKVQNMADIAGESYVDTDDLRIVFYLSF